jgi:virulence-associated protein VapD
MLHTVKPAAWMTMVMICLTGMGSIAWQKKPVTVNHNHPMQDTIPNKEKEDETIINGNLDKAMEQVKRAKENLERQLQNKNWEKLHQDLEQSLENLQPENIQLQVAKAMKAINFQKIQLQAQAELNQIDWGKMQKDLQKATGKLKAVDMENMQLQLEKATTALKMNEGYMREGLERAKQEIKQNFNKNFNNQLEKAGEEIDRATEELQNYKDMLDELDKDGLLHASEPYTIKYKNGDLFINGKQQPAAITNKYKHYFKKGNVKIKSGKEEEDDKTIYL